MHQHKSATRSLGTGQLKDNRNGASGGPLPDALNRTPSVQAQMALDATLNRTAQRKPEDEERPSQMKKDEDELIPQMKKDEDELIPQMKKDEDELIPQMKKDEDELIPQMSEDELIPQMKKDEDEVPQMKSNDTGLPDSVKSGVETLSGQSLDGVNVHYNSPKPTQLNALAYTQGKDIHVAPGQQQHVGHEAWHVVQQMEGRVTPTASVQGVQVNDDHSLEREADVMGARAETAAASQRKEESR
jgi:hypothetical protein